MKTTNRLELGYGFYNWVGCGISQAYYRYSAYRSLIDYLIDQIGIPKSDAEAQEIDKIASIVGGYSIKPHTIDVLVKFLNDPVCDLLKKHSKSIYDKLINDQSASNP
jgi:hypothetical protein